MSESLIVGIKPECTCWQFFEILVSKFLAQGSSRYEDFVSGITETFDIYGKLTVIDCTAYCFPNHRGCKWAPGHAYELNKG